jgi:tRNA pseudouridine65 synthase
MEQLEILYQDDYLVVINKPVDLPVHKNDFMPNDAPYVTKLVGQHFERSVYNVHRLDAKTSGVLLLAFSSVIAKLMTQQFEQKKVTKTYLALVLHQPDTEGVFDDQVVIKKKKKRVNARTHYRTLKTISTDISYKTFENVKVSLVEVEPQTGRWHQIRQHFAMHRNDIVGDTQHGDWTFNKLVTEQTGMKRLYLHASGLKIEHPVFDEAMEFKSSIPPEFDFLLEELQSGL